MLRHVAVSLSSLLLISCGPADSGDQPAAALPIVETGARSLVPGDASVVSDSAIAGILRHQVALPARSRIAVLQIGGRPQYRWSVDGAGVSQASLGDTAAAALRAHPRVLSAAMLPSLLLPEKLTVPHLREAAARVQADLLFVYRPDCETFHNSRIFRRTNVDAGCTVEAMILDVRSGIVPFNRVVSQALQNARAGDEEPTHALLLRAEVEALAAALRAVSMEAVGFVAGTGVSAGGSACANRGAIGAPSTSNPGCAR